MSQLMKKSNAETFLSVPQKQSSVAILLILGRLIKTVIKQAWPLLLLLLFRGGGSGSMFWTYVIVGVAGFSALISLISYFRFYFYVQDDELVIEKGVFQRTKLNIPFDRIQTVNFQQSIIHQIFDVVSVEIDTAGSQGNEFSILALGKKKAEAIRQYLIAQAKEHNPIVEEETTVAVVAPQKDKLLLKLSFVDLMKVGVGQNHIRTAFVILGFFWGIGEMFEDALGDAFWDELKEAGIYGRENIVAKMLIGGVSMAIAAFFLSMISTALRFYDLRFLKTGSGFKMIAGLFTRKERAANLEKIQLVQWTTNPVKSFFGLFDVQLSQASSSMMAQKQSIYVPGCYKDHVDTVRQAYFPEEFQLPTDHFGISPLVVYRRMLYQGLLPVIIATPLLYVNFEGFAYFAFLTILWLPINYFLSKRYYKNWKITISQEGLYTKSGVIGERHHLLKWFKVQAVSIKQSIYQRRKNLGDIYFYTAAGSIKIPYLKMEYAEALRDYALYKIESSEEKWM